MYNNCNENILPYRNTIKKSKDFKLNKNMKYKNSFNTKPNGFWYQINNCAQKWGNIDWGNHIYKVEVDTSNFLKINNYNDLIKFTKKYRLKRKFKISYNSSNSLNSLNLSKKKINKVSSNSKIKPNKKKYMTFVYILWEHVARKYSGIEINNFEGIMNHIAKLKEKNGKEFDIMIPSDNFYWFYTLDFSSGCVWDISKVKNVEYFGEYVYSEKNNSISIKNTSTKNLKKKKTKKKKVEKKLEKNINKKRGKKTRTKKK
tara:strand:+ start:6492 stop:7265 length:774 start_codon:yes stop_codon:yes gene_type:complete